MYHFHGFCKHILSTMLIMMICLLALADTAGAAGSGVINGSVVNVRSGPGTDYTIAGTLLRNTQVQIIQTQGSWYKIQFGSLTGWVSSTLITAGQSAATSNTAAPATNSTIAAAASPRVLLDGKEMSFEVPPIILNNRTLVPVRAIFEALGATVQWNEAAQTVTAVKGGKMVVLPLNSTSPTINGVVCPIDTPAQVINNRTLAPLGFVGEAFDATVSWDAATRTVYLSSSLLGTQPDDPPQTPTQPAQPDSSIKLSSSRDENGLRIIMQSDVALTPEINQSSGQVVYRFDGRQMTGTNFLKQALGSDAMTVQTVSDAEGTTITFKLPAQVKYETLSQNEGKTLIFSIPNYIISLQTADYGNGGKKIVLSTLCPVKYTSRQNGTQVQVTLMNILQGKASSNNYINNQYLDSIKITAGKTSPPELVLNIAARTLGKVSFETSGTNNNTLNIILSGESDQPAGNTGGTTPSAEDPVIQQPAEYPVIQQYIVNNRPGTPLEAIGQVVHATADPGATAQNIRDYFNNHYAAEASTHAVIDWDTIIEMIPEDEVAWHAGPTANSQFLSFEMCEPDTGDPDRSRKFQEVWKRAVWYCAQTCVKYGWNTGSNIFSHYGVSLMYKETNHTDPYGYFASYGKSWDQFLADVDAKIAQLRQ